MENYMIVQFIGDIVMYSQDAFWGRFMSSNVRKWWSWPWDVGDGLGDLVTEALVSKGNYRVLERAQMKRIHRRGQDRRDRHIGHKARTKLNGRIVDAQTGEILGAVAG